MTKTRVFLVEDHSVMRATLTPYEIAGAIRDVMEGGTYISDSLR